MKINNNQIDHQKSIKIKKEKVYYKNKNSIIKYNFHLYN